MKVLAWILCASLLAGMTGSALSAPRGAVRVSRPARPSGGFNLNRDVAVAPRPAPVPANRVANVNQNINVNRNLTVNRNVSGVVVRNPIYYGGAAWGWNHGVVWHPAPIYWGGGFWGALALTTTAAAVYGSIVSNSVTYTSYQVQSESPGATLLSNYQLVQIPCGPPNVVVIYGPNNSVICAQPNTVVAAGTYKLDTSSLSIVSM